MRSDAIYLTCPPMGVERVSSVYAAIETWVRSSALLQLVDDFRSKVPDGLSVEDLVTWLLKFSERWDFRRLQREAVAKDIGEGARWLTNDSNITTQQQALIEESAKILGLIGIDEPVGVSYDYLMVLGGARLSCLLRPRLAAQLIDNENVKPKAIILLASSRPVADSEREATDTYAPGARNEFELMNAGAEISFQIPKVFTEDRFDDPTNVNKSWVIRKYNTDRQSTSMISVSAPSSEPGQRRANSSDTYEFFFSKFNVSRGSSLLLVTSQIYVPYQQLEAIRSLALPHEVTVETVGFPPEWGGKLHGMVGPTNYLQEIRSTIQSAHRFISLFPRRTNS